MLLIPRIDFSGRHTTAPVANSQYLQVQVDYPMRKANTSALIQRLFNLPSADRPPDPDDRLSAVDALLRREPGVAVRLETGCRRTREPGPSISPRLSHRKSTC